MLDFGKRTDVHLCYERISSTTATGYLVPGNDHRNDVDWSDRFAFVKIERNTYQRLISAATAPRQLARPHTHRRSHSHSIRQFICLINLSRRRSSTYCRRRPPAVSPPLPPPRGFCDKLPERLDDCRRRTYGFGRRLLVSASEKHRLSTRLTHHLSAALCP